jgi:3-dehydroquinate synthase
MKNAELKSIKKTLSTLQLPTATDIPLPTLISALLRDKKKSGDSLHLILPVGIGQCEVRELKLSEVEKMIYEL